LRCTSRDHIH